MKTFVLIIVYWVNGYSPAISTIENYSTLEECEEAKFQYTSLVKEKAWCIPGPTKK